MVLLYPEGALRLDQTAADILSLCDGQRSIDEIARSSGRNLRRARRRDFARDVIEFVNLLHTRQFIRFTPGSSSNE